MLPFCVKFNYIVTKDAFTSSLFIFRLWDVSESGTYFIRTSPIRHTKFPVLKNLLVAGWETQTGQCHAGALSPTLKASSLSGLVYQSPVLQSVCRGRPSSGSLVVAVYWIKLVNKHRASVAIVVRAYTKILTLHVKLNGLLGFISHVCNYDNLPFILSVALCEWYGNSSCNFGKNWRKLWNQQGGLISKYHNLRTCILVIIPTFEYLLFCYIFR